MSLNACNCHCHQGTGVTLDGCASCWAYHQNPFIPEPNVTVTSNINEITLEKIVQLLKDILEELKKKK